MYLSLDPHKIIKTADQLSKRMDERFPDRGLSEVAREICQMTRETTAVARWLQRPMIWYRVVAGTLIGLIFLILGFVLITVNPTASEVEGLDWHEVVEVLEAGVNDLIFLAVAIFFLIRAERRFKRERALQTLHKLRSLAHIVDMHQLNKDPDTFAQTYRKTASSPEHHMNPSDMKRYFDYCSEMLALCGKMAALIVQDFNDPVTLTAVNEIEILTTGLSRKIWQKIMVASSLGNLGT